MQHSTELNDEYDEFHQEVIDIDGKSQISLQHCVKQSLIKEIPVTDRELVEASTHLLEMERNLYLGLPKESDNKQSAQISVLSTWISSSSEPNAAESSQENVDEAEKIIQLDRLQENFDKEQIADTHQGESGMLDEEQEKKYAQRIKIIRAEFQQAMENNRVCLEKLANDQLEQLHGQYFAVYEVAIKEKNALIAELEVSKQQVSLLQAQINCLQDEKRQAESMLKRLRETHSEEVNAIQQASQELETRLQCWQSKASSLESRLQQTADEETSRQKATTNAEERTEIVCQECEELFKVKQSEIKELGEKLFQKDRDHSQIIKGLKDQHQSKIEELQFQHSGVVRCMEQRITECMNAMVKMEHEFEQEKSVHKESSTCCDQETLHQAHILSLQQEHQLKLAALKEEMKKKNDQTLKTVQSELLSSLQKKKTEIARLKQQLEDKLQVAQQDKCSLLQWPEAVRGASFKCQQEHNAWRRDMEAEYDRVIQELKLEHKSTLEALKSHHSSELCLLKESINEQEGSKASLEFAEAHMKELQHQLNAYRNQDAHHQAEVLSLKHEHQGVVAELNRVQQLYVSDKAKLLSELNQSKEEVCHLKEMLCTCQNELEEKSKVNRLSIAGDDNELQSDLLEASCSAATDQLLMMQPKQQLHENGQNYYSFMNSQIEEVRKDLAHEIGEVRRLQAANKAAVEGFQAQIAELVEGTFAEAKTQILNLEGKLRNADNLAKETRKLQELCQKHHTELIACRVDLSIAHSALKEEKQAMKTLLAEEAELVGKVKQLEATLENVQTQHFEELEQLRHIKEEEVATETEKVVMLQSQINIQEQQLEQERQTSATQLQEVQQHTARVTQLEQQLNISCSKESDTMSELWQQIADKEDAIVRLQSTLTLAEQNLSQQLAKATVAYNELTIKSSQQLSELNEQLQQAKDNVTQTGKEKEKLCVVVAGLQEQVRSLLEQISGHTFSNTATAIDLKECKEQITALLSHNHKLSELLKKEIEEKNFLFLQVKELENAQIDHFNKHKLLLLAKEEELSTQTTATRTLQTQVDVLAQKLQDERQKMAVIQKDEKLHAGEVAELKEQLSVAYNRESDSVTTLRQQVADGNDTIVTLQNKLFSIEQQMNQHQEKATELTTHQLHQLSQQLQLAEDKVIQAAKLKPELYKTMADLLQQVQCLQEQSSLPCSSIDGSINQLEGACGKLPNFVYTNQQLSNSVAALHFLLKDLNVSGVCETEQVQKEKNDVNKQLSHTLCLVEQLRAQLREKYQPEKSVGIANLHGDSYKHKERKEMAREQVELLKSVTKKVRIFSVF